MSVHQQSTLIRTPAHISMQSPITKHYLSPSPSDKEIGRFLLKSPEWTCDVQGSPVVDSGCPSPNPGWSRRGRVDGCCEASKDSPQSTSVGHMASEKSDGVPPFLLQVEMSIGEQPPSQVPGELLQQHPGNSSGELPPWQLPSESQQQDTDV